MNQEIIDLLEKARESNNHILQALRLHAHISICDAESTEFIINNALTLLKQPKCKTCGDHKGTIKCPECDAQICWIDIDHKREGFMHCRRCKTPETKFIKVPCPDCQQPAAGEFTKEVRQFIIQNTAVEGIDQGNLKQFLTKYGEYMSRALKIIDSEEARLKIIPDLLAACESYIRHMELHDSSEHPKANMFCTECPRYRKGIEAAIAKVNKVGE